MKTHCWKLFDRTQWTDFYVCENCNDKWAIPRDTKPYGHTGMNRTDCDERIRTKVLIRLQGKKF